MADPSDLHPLFELHGLLNSPFVGDAGTGEMVIKTWEQDAGMQLTLENFTDLALLHAELTSQRGPQRVVNAIMCERKTPEEPTLPGAEKAFDDEDF